MLATLHQPTDAMFLGFDSLLLLRDGEASYAGDPQNAVAAIAPKPPPRGAGKEAAPPNGDEAPVCRAISLLVHKCGETGWAKRKDFRSGRWPGSW